MQVLPALVSNQLGLLQDGPCSFHVVGVMTQRFGPEAICCVARPVNKQVFFPLASNGMLLQVNQEIFCLTSHDDYLIVLSCLIMVVGALASSCSSNLE